MKIQVIRKILLIIIATVMATMNAQAQYEGLFPRRMGCTGHLGGAQETRSDNPNTALCPMKDWDASREYRQLVILLEFSDSTFSCENPREYYDRLFNEQGYNEGVGPGCVADYFREQSGGLCNLKFDIMGPYKVSEAAKKKGSYIYGEKAISEGIDMLIADRPDMDYKIYDWDGDGNIEQVVIIFASYTGNDVTGFIWPNTGYIGKEVTEGMSIINSSCSCELWEKGYGCGIGTICHEYSHCLGLPDVYPTGYSKYFSICDEFDLMDGGNYTNWGWCPPNLTAMEKMYLNWATPVELDATTTISNLPSISDGGTSYLIRHTDTEYLLLENRQRKGWDAAIPGSGLIVTHIDYNEADWLDNRINNKETHFGYDIVHADNMNYNDWDKLYPHEKGEKQYVDQEQFLYNRHLSTSPYPWYDSATETENDCLTDTSVPTVVMFNDNAEGSKQFGKSITNIRVADDGTVSFDFTMETTGIREALLQDDGQRSKVEGQRDSVEGRRSKVKGRRSKVKGQCESWFTIDGRRLAYKPSQPGIYLYKRKKIMYP